MFSLQNITVWKVILGIGIFLVFHYFYQKWLHRGQEYDEYVCDNLIIKIFYYNEEEHVSVDFRDYDKDGLIYMTILSAKAPQTEQDRELEGKDLKMGRAVVRCLAGTNMVMSWWYLK